MSARNLAATVAKRMMRDERDRISPHGDALTPPRTVEEAEDAGVLAKRRPATGETIEVEVVSYPRQVAEKVLGKGVHPAAVRRLFELWPEAVVAVEHFPGEGFNSVPLKVTRVLVRRAAEDSGTTVYADALCRLDTDKWDRHFGIRLAFNRALKAVKAAEDLRIMGGASPTAEAPRA